MKELGKNYWYLWTGCAVSTMGTYLSIIIINLFIYEVTGSPFLVGLFFLFRLLPAFFAGNIVSVLADKYDRRKMMILADLSRAVLIFSVVFLREGLYPLYFIVIGIAMCDRLYQSCLGGSIPNIVGKDKILNANSYLSAARTIGLLIGPVLGGLLASTKSYTLAFSIDSCSYLFSALMIFLMSAKFQEERPPEEKPLSMMEGLKQGYGFILARVGLLSVIIIRCLDAFGSAALNISIPIFSNKLGQLTPGLCYGLMYAAFGLGEVVGALYIARKPFITERPKEVVTGWAILFMGMFFGIALSMPSLELVLVFIFLSAVMEGITCVTYNIYLQKSPDNVRGRIVGTSETAVWTSMGIGMFITGLIAEKINIVHVVQVCAILIMLGCLIHLFIWKKRNSAPEVSRSESIAEG